MASKFRSKMINDGLALAFSSRSFSLVTYCSVTPARLAASVILAEKNRSLTTASTVFIDEYLLSRMHLDPLSVLRPGGNGLEMESAIEVERSHLRPVQEEAAPELHHQHIAQQVAGRVPLLVVQNEDLHRRVFQANHGGLAEVRDLAHAVGCLDVAEFGPHERRR